MKVCQRSDLAVVQRVRRGFIKAFTHTDNLQQWAGGGDGGWKIREGYSRCRFALGGSAHSSSSDQDSGKPYACTRVHVAGHLSSMV